MGISKRPLHARSGFIARACQLAGASVLVAGTALAVPLAMGLTAAPAGAVPAPVSDTLTGVTPSKPVPCQVNSDSVKAHTDWENICGQITITKVDSITGAPLKGAEFTLYWADPPKSDGSQTCDTENGPVSIPDSLTNPATTGADGTVTFSPVLVGPHFCVVETHAPDDYTASSDPVFVQVTRADFDCTDTSTNPPTIEGWDCAEGVSKAWNCVTEEKHQEEGVAAADANDNDADDPMVCNASATVKNTPDPGTVQIVKAWVGGGTEPTDGAPFSLLASDSSVAGTCIANAANNNSCTINNVTEGTYTLHESAVTGWTNANNDQTVPVKPGALTIVDVTNNTVTVVPTAAAGGTSSTAAVSGATTVHTGEAFAGSAPYVLAMLGFGATLLGFGIVRRRRLSSNA